MTHDTMTQTKEIPIERKEQAINTMLTRLFDITEDITGSNKADRAQNIKMILLYLHDNSHPHIRDLKKVTYGMNEEQLHGTLNILIKYGYVTRSMLVTDIIWLTSSGLELTKLMHRIYSTKLIIPTNTGTIHNES